ncbi:MAG: DNA repair protein RecO [Bacteroidia bacterium]|nr:DNA repair protein RecO [Bacteroidia bacterium]
MLAKTKAIVLRNTNYSETSVISKMYTRELGVRTYMLQGVKRKKSAIKPAMIQPLSLLDLDVYDKPNAGINRVKEMKTLHLLVNIPESIVKKTIALFLVEVLNQCLIEEHFEHDLFDFIENQVIKLENEEHLGMFPIQFLAKLTVNLGVQPQGSYSPTTPYLNLEEGVYELSSGQHKISEISSRIFSEAMLEKQSSSFTSKERKEALDAILMYYKIHITKNRQIKSKQILADILN